MLGYSGGDVTVARLASDMANLLSSPWDFGFFTSLVDFYGFRDKGDATPDELQQRIDEAVNQKMGRDWDQSRLFSYVQQYEFESLLFSDFRGFAGLPDISDNSMTALREIRTRFQTPEDINDSPATAPSKRIAQEIPKYIKHVHGPLLAEQIGLDTIRSQRPRFNAWLARLESLANTAHPL